MLPSTCALRQHFQDLGHSFSLYGPASLQITYIYLTDISADGVGVQIAAPAREGEANEELVRYLAGILTVKKRSISLDKGSKSRQKMVTIDSAETSVDQVRERLSREALLK